MFLKRKITATLKTWKSSEADKKALCIFGARQIGKTTAVRQFAEDENLQLCELNFLEDLSAGKIFENSRNPEEILENISAYKRIEFTEGKTLFLFDEIQECPKARTAIKFLVEKTPYFYIETGSMLGVKLSEIRSFPVGFETITQMYPMDFEEFCWASQVPENVIQRLETSWKEKQPLPESLHESMLQLFAQYIVVGGMPDAVVSYITHHNIATVINVQNNLLALFRKDIISYADKRDKLKILEVFESIPSQLDEKNKRFYAAKIDKNARIVSFSQCFEWLDQAGISLPCLNVTQPVAPLHLSEKRNLFKLFLFDTGLLCAASLGNVQQAVLMGETDINSGSLLENVFATQLVSAGFELFYYNSKKIGEVDFIVQNEKDIYALEIKSGNDYTHHPALDNLLDVKDWTIKQAIVFCKGNLKNEGSVLYCPWYLIPFFKKEITTDALFPPISFEAFELD